jgi:hypothetical protein
MISTTSYVTNRQPAQELIGLWRSAGVNPGLPRWMDVTNADGTPAWRFIGLCKKAFGLEPGEGLAQAEVIFDQQGKPTDYMITKWAAWTS